MFSNLDMMAFGIHQSKRKWLFLGIYEPTSQNDIEFLRRTSLIFDYHLSTYENFVLIGDFNLAVENSHLDSIIQAYNLRSLIKKSSCH